MKLRETTFEDYEAVKAVCHRNGLSTKLSRDEWCGLWKDNPHRDELGGIPIGWVLESDEGQVVGTVSNIPLVYEWNGRRIRAVAGSAGAVDVPHRSYSLLLIDKYFSLKNVDLLINTTASPATSQIWAAYKANRVPVCSCGEWLRWITDYAGCVANALSRKGIPVAGIVKHPIALALRCADWARGWNRMGSADGSVHQVEGFDERFDAFWSALRRVGDRLLAVRDRATLSWHFGPAIQRGDAVILALEDSAELAGYAVFLRRIDHDTGRRVWTLADLQVLADSDGGVASLMAHALHLSRRQNVHILNVLGLGARKRRILERWRPRRHQQQAWPFFFKALEPEFHTALKRPEAWDPTLFDGDASLT